MNALKYILFLALAPFWVPFVKELWGEFLLAMRHDGGLFKPPPGPVERKKLERELADAELRVVHEKKPGFQTPAERSAPRPSAGPQLAPSRRPFIEAAKRGGFR